MLETSIGTKVLLTRILTTRIIEFLVRFCTLIFFPIHFFDYFHELSRQYFLKLIYSVTIFPHFSNEGKFSNVVKMLTISKLEIST